MPSTADITENPEAEADIEFQPIVQLKPVEVKTLEDDEEEVYTQRAKLFRFDDSADPPEWKERGIGDMRILKHKSLNRFRLIMRREKTLKIACNHYYKWHREPTANRSGLKSFSEFVVTRVMKLKPHAASDRAFVWTTLADFADEEAKQELLAIRLKNAEEAKKFLTKFEELQSELPEEEEADQAAKSTENKENESATETITDKLDKLTMVGDGKSDNNTDNTAAAATESKSEPSETVSATEKEASSGDS